MMIPERFIELNRCFRDITESDNTEETALRSYVFGFNNGKPGLGWDELIESRVVVILGEPGSGKTWELRNRAKIAKDKGSFAFFVPLDRLVDSQLLDAISPSDAVLFSKFKISTDPVIFFLDSVDESRLRNPKDFARALDQFVRGVGHFGACARIVISSRISEWRWHADREELIQRFGPFPTLQDSSQEAQEAKKPPDLRIVQIEPLDHKQVSMFAQGFGVNDPDAFVQALDHHHAWEFARRPIDTASLITYWRERGELGTLSELIEFDLTNKLKESTDRNDLLSAAHARLGAECLAAAVLFCRRSSLFVPDLLPPVDTNVALNVSDCLPSDWTVEMHKAILARAIFDSASYGRIRFHHRRAAEYLTAKWLQKRMLEGCPYPELEDELFLKHRDTWIIRPHMRPVAAWVALGEEPWNRRVREHILSYSPDLFLMHGDPESLPSGYKQSLLIKLIDQYTGRDWAYLEEDDQALSRLADPALASFINEKLKDIGTPQGIRILFARIVRLGRLSECLDAILEMAGSDEAKELWLYAVAAIRDIGDKSARERLARIVEHHETIESRYCSLLCETLYPEVVGPRGLANLIRKAKDVPLHSVGLPFYLKQHLKKAMPDKHAAELLNELVLLFQADAVSQKEEEQLAPEYYWLGKIIPLVLTRLLSRPRLDHGDADLAARTLWLLECFKRHPTYNLEIPAELQVKLEQKPEVRRAHFWFRVSFKLKCNPSEDARNVIFGYWGAIVKLGEADIDWLIRDLHDSVSVVPKHVALHVALFLGAKRKRHYHRLIRNAIKDQPLLLQTFRQEVAESFTEKSKRLWDRHWVYDLKPRSQRIWYTIRGKYFRLKDRFWFLRRLSSLRNGTAIDPLSHLASEASEQHNRWGADSWRSLEREWGRTISRAAGTGWKIAWPQHRPSLPHEIAAPNSNRLLSVGLSGINVAVSEGMSLADLTPDEAGIACRYALNEMNGVPEWFSDLVRFHPDVVRAILIECIHGEWRIPADIQNYIGGVLRMLCYSGQVAVPLVKAAILEELKSADPPYHQVLNDSLTILLKSSEPPIQVLGVIAAERTPRREIGDPALGLWLAVWLQVDAGPALKYMQKLSVHPSFGEFLESFCSGFSSFRSAGYTLIEKPDFHRPALLSEFIHLVFDHIRPEDDINRANKGPYSVTPRDEAQRYRDSLLERLSQFPEHEAETALRSFAIDLAFSRYRDWILHLIEKRIKNLDDTPPWQPKDVPLFMNEHETEPQSDHQLFKIALKRVVSIKDEVERGEISSRYDLHPDDVESHLRSWLARQLRERSRKHYTVPQETEIDLGQKPDLRVEAPGMGPVSIEVKWADNWPLKDLATGLVDQLVGQYLRAVNSNYGIYIVGYKGQKASWDESETGQRLSFCELIQHLEKMAESLTCSRKDFDGLRVFGLDFSRPAGAKKKAR